MRDLDLLNPYIPMPHLESFLSEIQRLSPELIGHDFIALLYANSVEDLTPTEQQVVYAKMLACGFAKSPNRFASHLNFHRNADSSMVLETISRFSSMTNITGTAVELAWKIFGLDIDVQKNDSQKDINPSANYIRLSQTGVISVSSLNRLRDLSGLVESRKYLGISRLDKHDLTASDDELFASHCDNEDALAMLCITSDTSLAADAVMSKIDAPSVLKALRQTTATPEAVVQSKLNGIDDNLLSFMLGDI